jgi:ribonuclease P protein component
MEKTYTFPRSRRIVTPAEFSATMLARVRESRGPVTLYGLPNELGHPRLGLSVSRRVGTAPRRNLIKRRLREAFRLHQHDLPVGYDFVIVVRPHEPLILAEYQRMLTSLMLKLHSEWTKRRAGGDL